MLILSSIWSDIADLVDAYWDAVCGLFSVSVGFILDCISSAVVFLYTTIIAPIVSALLDLLLSMLPDDWAAYLAQKPWLPLLDYVDDLNWFVPIYTIMGIMSTALAIAAGIRAARWVKSMWPAAFGGGGSG